MTRWIGTANQGYSPYAMEELRRMFPGASFEPLAPGETFLAELPRKRDEVTRELEEQPPIFLRHMQPVEFTLPVRGNAEDLTALGELVRAEAPRLAGRTVAAHIRKMPGTPYPYAAIDSKEAIDAALEEAGAIPQVRNADLLFAVYAGTAGLYAGIGTAREMLSDWPGGAIRFQREEGQISRAKFKLLEAERVFGLDYASFRRALDIGAAPGGWTSLLLERGLSVTAVDPAELHPSLLKHERLVYERKNASEVRYAPGTFDLLVCDMSWSPALMSKLVLNLADALAEGATAIVTVKLMHRKPFQTIRETTARLSQAYRVLRAKQLFHNRDEVTLHLARKL